MSKNRYYSDSPLLSKLMSLSEDIIIILSYDYEIIEINHTLKKLIPDTKKLVGKNFLVSCEKKSIPLTTLEFRALISGNKLNKMISSTKENFYYFSWSVHKVSNEDPYSQILVIANDITDAKRVYFLNKKNQTQLERISEVVPGNFYWKNVSGEYLGCNLSLLSMLGMHSIEEIIGKNDYDLWPEQANDIRSHDKQVMLSKKTVYTEESVNINDKNMFFTVIKMPLFGENDQVIGILGNSLDITKQKEMEEDLKVAKIAAESALKSLQQSQIEEAKHREEAERLAIENAANKAELETQAKFITVVNRIAHDVAGSMGAIKKMTKYFSGLKEITAISGYEMRPISASEREDNIIYIQTDNNGLQYEVLDSQKELKKGVVSWEQLFAQLKQDASKIESDFLEFQKEYLPVLLGYTARLGHTKKKMNERRIPEAQRIQLENSTQKAITIMEGILSKYLNPEENQDESISVFPPSLAIHDAFAETRLNYEHQGIHFIEEFNPNSQMVFIEGQRSQINRAITNLLRNAAQALDGKPGDVVLKLDSDEFYVYITIADTGKGMAPGIVDKIKNNIAFTEGKKDGHGIGLGQVYATLNRNSAEMDIISELGKGTQFIIKFKKSLPPNWAAQTIEITSKDKIIIVDDDPSIHGDWGFNFEPIIEKYPSISLHNFYESQKALDYIHGLPLDEHNNILLLSDFELANDARNGLNVIEESKVKRAFLVTSHCNEPDIQQTLLKFNAKLLPKKLNQYIPIIVLENKAEYSETNLKEVDGIWLDDDAGFTLMHEQDLVVSGKKVDIYRSPKALMDNIHIYPKHIPILLDNNFEATSIQGTAVAKDLHELGFTKLFLVSGDKLNPNDYPYLTILSKGDLDDICKYF